MSEDPTKDIPQKYDTKPTIETVLERMEAMRSDIMQAMHSEIQAVRVDMQKMQTNMQVGFDRIESIVSGTRAEFLTLRADFRELRQALGEHLPASKA